jgi:DUF971 family protein
VPSTRPPEATRIERLSEVGRYALGVTWADHHESILPYRTLRAACPCELCGKSDTRRDPAAERPARVESLGDKSLFVAWADHHETILLLEELRDLCRCARCAGEPEYPISGR